MASISRISHIVLHVSRFDDCVAFYRDVIGMEVVSSSKEPGRAFLSFGTQHHDIGVFEDTGEKTRGTLGLAHVALQVDGGMEELRSLHDRLVAHGVEIGRTRDHGMTKSVYFSDPDGNTVEFCLDTFADPAEGLQYMREQGGRAKPLAMGEAAKA